MIVRREEFLQAIIRSKIISTTYAFQNRIENSKTKEDLKRVFYPIASKVNGNFPPELERYIAKEEEIRPDRIKVEIEFVDSKTSKEIFRAMKSFWSVPVSDGYGRRINVIVWDRTHNKVIGIAGLCDPVIGLKVRDDFIGWGKEERHERLYNTMTAYILGAVPPYNRLRAGKLVALLVRSREILEEFRRKYTGRKTIIAEKEKPAELVMIDTMGAFGKSSIYNRLRDWHFIGYSKGYTHHHLTYNGLFDMVVEYIKTSSDADFREIARKNKFGHGANWKFRVISEAVKKLGIKGDVLNIGITRGYYATFLAKNWKEYLTLQTDTPEYQVRSADEEFEYWKERWLKWET